MRPCKHCGTRNDDNASFCTECSKPLPARDMLGVQETYAYDPKKSDVQEQVELETGHVFANRYTIVEKIGQGGMGVVYLATEELGGTTRDVALKLIRADRLVDDKAIDKLISEGVLTQNIRHPNVVAVYNVGQFEGQPFVAMDHVSGVSLREWHRRRVSAREEVSLPVAAAIIHSLLDGLEAAHRVGIIHRDLKPENVMLTEDPEDQSAQLQILDFGIARAPGTVDTVSSTGLGTPRYMAPEQITHPDSAGPPADLYSLSVIFYELLMDVLPQGHWQPPSGGRTDVSAAIDELIHNGLSNRPASRPQTVEEYRGLLNTAIEQEKREVFNPEPTPPPPVPPPSPPNPDMKKWMIGGGIGLAVVLIIALADEDGTFDGDGGYYDGEVPEDIYVGPGSEGPVADSEAGLDLTEDVSGELPETPVTPQPTSQASYAYLGGQWFLPTGGWFNATVADDGSFSGESLDAVGNRMTITGSIPAGSYRLRNQIGTLNGKLTWDRGCHLDYETYAPNGMIAERGTLHIDHPDGAPCPARFGQ